MLPKELTNYIEIIILNYLVNVKNKNKYETILNYVLDLINDNKYYKIENIHKDIIKYVDNFIVSINLEEYDIDLELYDKLSNYLYNLDNQYKHKLNYQNVIDFYFLPKSTDLTYFSNQLTERLDLL